MGLNPRTGGQPSGVAAAAFIVLLTALAGSFMPGAAAQNPPPGSGESAAWSTAQPFDLQSDVKFASFDLRQPDLRTLYDSIAESYGISLVYDPEIGGLPVSGSFRLQDATLQEALEAAASISRTFVAPLDPRTGIVAADTPAKRAQFERQVLGSFHLDSQLTPQQLTEVSNALRTIVDLRRVTQDTRSNWITVLGRTRQVEAARQFVASLDKPTGEVMLEIDVWEIALDRARQIGIAPPLPLTLRFLGTGQQQPSVPLLEWGQVQTIYGLQIPGLTAFLRSSGSLVRSHQQLRLRATDGQEARLLVGERIPVITTIVSAAIVPDEDDPDPAQGFIPGIQYQDVGVVVNATPRLHGGQELTLELDIALRSVTSVNENGIPSFSNRQLTGQVRLGGDQAYLIGGILSNRDSSIQAGYPWLARIPILGLFFGNRQRQESDTELLIMVRPIILRLPAAEQFASRSIFFGKELTGLPAAVPLAPVEPATEQEIPPGGIPVPEQPQPGTLPAPGQPPQPGAIPGPQPFPQGFPFPPGAFPQGVGIQPGVAPQPAEPPQPDPSPAPLP